MATTVKSLLIKIGVDVSAMEAGFKKAESTIQKNADQFRKAGRRMTVAGAAITGMTVGLVKAFADFDNAMTESTAIMGDLSDDMRKKMAAAAKQMSRESTFAAKELAKSYFYLASAGLDAEQSIAALPVVTRFAQAGAFELARATDLLTDAQSALGLSSKDAVKNQENMLRVSDVLVKANTLANASVGQFSEALTNKAGPAMRAYGIKLESGVAVLAAFADQGVKGQVAGEQYSIVLRDLQRAALENSEGFKKAGVAVFDASGNLNDMGVVIGQLEDRLGTMSAEQKKSELSMLGFQERSQGALLTLMGTSEKIKEYNANLKIAQGTTEEVAKKQLESLTAQLKLAWNAISIAAISLGEKLAPAVKEIAEKISGLVRKIEKWIEENPKLAGTILKIFAGVGLLLTVLGPLAMVLPSLVTGFTMLGGAISAMCGPVGLAALAITGIALLIKDMIDTLKEAKKEMRDFADEATIFADAAENFKKLWIVVQKEGGETLEQFNELMKRFGGDWDSIMKTIVKDPKFATLKVLLLDIAGGVKEVDLEGKKLSIRLPNSFGKVDEAAKKIAATFDGLKEKAAEMKEKLVSIHDALVNELKRATLGEYEYAKWVAEKKYKDRETALKKELEASKAGLEKMYLARKGTLEKEVAEGKASKDDFLRLDEAYADEKIALEKAVGNELLLLKKVHATETEAIEKAQTKAVKDQWEERGRQVRRGLEKIREFYDTYEERLEGHRDVVKQYTMSAFDYQLEKLDEWYEGTKESYKKIYGETELFYSLLTALQEEYNARRKALEEEAKLSGLEAIYAIGQATANLFSQIGALAQTHFDNQLMALDSETEARREAADEQYEAERERIENSLMSEAEKEEALEALDEKKAAADEKLEKDTEKKRKAIQKKAFETQKKISLVTAAINIAEAVTKAYTGAIPPFNFILAALVGAAGLVQLTAIAGQKFPSAEKGAWLPKPTLIEAGHGAGEVISPVPVMKEAFRETMAESIPLPDRYYFDITTYIGEERFYSQVVKMVNKAGRSGDLKVPIKVLVR